MNRRALLLVLASAAVAGCKTPDPQAILEVSEVETYWAVDRARGQTTYMAPAVRFKVRNRSGEPARSIQATATFRRKGEEHLTWGSDWRQVTPAGAPLGAGATQLVQLKSDARYFSDGPPTSFFQHPQFKDVKVEVFLRVGPSGWAPFAQQDVDRRVGARSVQEFAPQDGAPGTVPSSPSPAAPR